MSDIRDFSVASPSAARITDISAYVSPTIIRNPIANFYDARTAIVRAGSAQHLMDHPVLGGVLMVAAVSAFEDYVRSVLSQSFFICPQCQAKASDKNIMLGGAIWHGTAENLGRGVFEHKSFTDIKELKNVLREYVGLDLADSLFSEILSSTDAIMQLRHAVVHAGGFLPARNAIKLEVRRCNSPQKICIDSLRLQQCLAVLSNLVEMLNRELFSLMCRRWAIDWRSRADWDADHEDKRLAKIFRIFCFTDRHTTRTLKRVWGLKSLKSAIYAQYGLDHA